MSTAAQRSGPLASIGEYFTLRRALEAHDGLPAAARERVASALALGRQRADAAEALWSNGHAAEALRLAIAALDASAEGVRALADGRATPVRLGTAGAPAASATREERSDDAASEASPAAEAGGDASTDDASSDDASTDDASSDDASTATAGTATAGTATVGTATAGTATAGTAAAGTADEPFPSADPAAIRATTLRAHGVAPARISSVEAALTAARGATLPSLDADVSPTHAELFRQVIDAHRVIDRALSNAGLGRRELQLARAGRIGTATFFTLLVVLGVYFATRRPEGVFVETSAVWANAPAFGGETVIDGRADTYWLVPDGAAGWVEVRIAPSQRIEHVTVLNAHNPPHGDRATRDYRIEIYANGALARSIDDSFEYSTTPEPVTHDVGIDDVERIRFVVRSHHRTGAGLAELSWD